MIKHNITKFKLTTLLIIAVAACFMLHNFLTPLVNDDYSYAFIWDGEHGGNLIDGIGQRERVNSFSDIFQSQWSHYFTWGGRVIPHIFVQFFMWAGKDLFNICNTIVFIILLWLINYIATGQKNFSKITLIWLLIGFWFCVPEYMFTVLWLTGACNYLWMSLLQLLFLLPYLRQSDFMSKTILLLIIAFLAGGSNEAGAIASICAAAGFTLYSFKQGKIQSNLIAGLIIASISCAIMILAPGNWQRLQVIQPDFAWNLEILMEHLKGPFLHFLLQEVILFAPIIYCLIKCRIDPKIKILIIIFTLAGLLVPMSLLGSPVFFMHGAFSATIFLLVASTAALNEIIADIKFTTLPAIIKCLSFAVIAITILSVSISLYADFNLHEQMKLRFDIINQQRGNDLIIVPPIKPSVLNQKFIDLKILDEHTALYYFTVINSGIFDYPTSVHNILFAQYHELKNIVQISF